jgi:tRNA(Leu) C34 or U34 (ribose-2'-O)-methylase TrmL
MDVFLDSPQDFGNLCLLSRTLEVLGVKRCYVHDPHRLIRQRYGKSRTRKIKTVSAGAFFRVAFKRVEAPEVFLAALPGRKVATVPDQHATSLFRFAFRADAVIVFGAEGRGIRPEVLALCDERVTIPALAKNRATPTLSGGWQKSLRRVWRKRDAVPSAAWTRPPYRLTIAANPPYRKVWHWHGRESVLPEQRPQGGHR